MNQTNNDKIFIYIKEYVSSVSSKTQVEIKGQVLYYFLNEKPYVDQIHTVGYLIFVGESGRDILYQPLYFSNKLKQTINSHP